jgi:GNAT superfamily N-acetyltransferase
MLVRLYDLPESLLPELPSTVTIRRPLASERGVVTRWVEEQFSAGWAHEVGVCFSRLPITTYIAVEHEHLIGFASYDATCLDFFGPMGVDATTRGRGIGRILLLAALRAMRDEGYAYAIIGWAGPGDFYRKCVGAVPIEGSTPGIYRGLLKDKKNPSGKRR